MDVLKQIPISFRAGVKNPILIVPPIFQGIITAIVAGVMLVLLFMALFTSQGIPLTADAIESYVPDARFMTIGMLMLAIAATIIFLITCWFHSGWFSMMLKIARKQKVSMVDFFQGIKTYFKDYLTFKILIALIWVIAFSPMAILAPLVMMGQVTDVSVVIAAILFVLWLIFISLFALAMMFVFSFSAPILFSDCLNAIDTFRATKSFIKSSAIVVLISVALIFGVQMVMSTASSIINQIGGSLLTAVPAWYVIIPVLLVMLLLGVVQLLISIWSHLFLFHVYEERKKELN